MNRILFERREQSADGTVLLEETELDGAADRVVLRVSHTGMLFSAEVALQAAAFLRSGRQEDFLCTARILKLGKRTAYGTVETVGTVSGLLAHHVLTYARVKT